MNKKLLYSAPEAELLVVKFEENFLQASQYSTPGAAGNPDPYAPGDGDDLD